MKKTWASIWTTVLFSAALQSAAANAQSNNTSDSFKNEANLEATVADSTTDAQADLLSQSFSQRLEFFKTAQSLLARFDQKLDLLYQKKLQNPQWVDVFDELEKDRFQLRLAWDYNERNSERLEQIYKRLLVSSKDEPAAKLALEKIQTTLHNEWATGDRWTVIVLAAELQSMNAEFRKQNSTASLPDFGRYSLTSPADRASAHAQSLAHFQNFPHQAEFARFLEDEWSKNQADLLMENISRVHLTSQESPRFFPSVGPQGTLTGSHFDSGVWAITLDDGPHPVYTRKHIDTLNQAGMKATFFWLSQNMQQYPALVKLAGDQGFRRGSHSFTHKNLQILREPGLIHEIDDAGEVFTKVVGQPATFFRCPYGNCGKSNSRIREKIAARHMMSVLWNIDSLDWQDKNPQSVFQRVKKQMTVAGHGIILFHDIQPSTVQALKLLVAYMKTHPDWKTYTMDEIMQIQNGTPYPSP